ncbi:hybrid sensor histidine kinase/response regulator [Pseudoxanthomonas suwonensis]|uniref:hybrid sensor histidine kinase/response regulator n=1 Tax=Pseudoxanthomonas suwonensis TaxID=314722 RepID=UPI00046439ED|nr:Hpt domain-containing protein [Pseudoxanthomonas suwonensis]
MSALRDAMSHAVLGWVKPELDETLRQARNEIEAFVEDPADTSRMRFCAGYLHQVQGTLRMVELYAPAMVAEELELLAQAVQQGAANDRDEACATLMRGTVLLPDYLERLQNGHRDIPIVLLPLLNDIRAARGAAGLNESVLFAPDLTRPLPEQVPQASQLPWIQRQDKVAAAQARFEQALGAWPEQGGPADPAALAQAAGELLENARHDTTRRMLWVLSSTADALRDGALPASDALRSAFAGVARALRQAYEDESAPTASQGAASQEPTRQLLYVVAQARAAHPALDALRQAFDLDALAPTEAELDHARGSLSGRNRELLNTVGTVVKEELLRVKDALDLHLRTGGDPGALQPQVGDLANVADTLGMLGLGVARDVVLQQRDTLDAIVRGDQPASESALLDIAGALLYVDASLDDQVSRLGAPGEESREDASAAAETLRTLEVLAQEAIANFAAAREHFVAFIETNWDHERLADVPRLLSEVSGALRILDLPQPADYLEGVRRYIGTELLLRHRVPSGRQLDTLADAMASLEYYLEALRDRRPNRDEILEIARSSLESLHYWPLPDEPEPVAPVVEPAAVVAVPAAAAPAPVAPAAASPWDPVAAEAASAPQPEALELPSLQVDLPPVEPAAVQAPDAGAVAAQWTSFDPVAAEAGDTPASTDAAPQAPATEEKPSWLNVSMKVEPEVHLGQVFEASNSRLEVDGDSTTLIAEITTAAANLDAPLPAAPAIEPAAAEAAAAPLAAEAAAAAVVAAPSADVPAAPVAPTGATIGGFDEAEDIDADIREVFLEEFEEERGNLERMVPEWLQASEDLERLRPIRRVFHTLKGSGRLVGARALGEFSWKIEGMLNRVLDGTRPPSPAVQAMVQLACSTLPQFDAALRGVASVQADIHAIEAVAERIAAGEEAFYSAPASVAVEAVAAPAAAEAAPAVVAAEQPLEGTPASVDSVLREILEAEVTQHLETVDAWLAEARPVPVAATDALLRAIHTMNGAFAMTDVPEITTVTDPAETFVKRSLAAAAVPSADAVDALASMAAAIRTCVAALQAESPRIPGFAVLSARLRTLADSLPEARWPQVADVEAPVEEPAAVDEGLTAVDDLSTYFDPAQLDEVAAALPGEPLAAADAAATAPVEEASAMAFDLASVAEDADTATPHEAFEPALADIDLAGTEAALASSDEAGAVEAAGADTIEFAEEAAADADGVEMADAGVIEFETITWEAEPVAAVADESPAPEYVAAETPAETEEVQAEAAADAGLVAADATPDVAEELAAGFEVEAEAAAEPETVEAAATVEAVEVAGLETGFVEVEAAAAVEATEASDAAGIVETAEAGEALEVVDTIEAVEAVESVEPTEVVEAQPEAADPVEAIEPVASDAVVAEVAAEAPAAEASVPAGESVEAAAPAGTPAPAVDLPALGEPVPVEAPAAMEDEVEADAPMLDFNELDRDLVDIFVEEGVDLLDHIDGLIQELRADTSARETIISLQRDLHTLKGGARMAGIATIGDLGHIIESLLEAAAEHRTELGRGDIQLLERGFDTLHRLLQQTRAHRATKMPQALIDQFEARLRGEPLPASVPAPAPVPAPAAPQPAAPAAEAKPSPVVPFPVRQAAAQKPLSAPLEDDRQHAATEEGLARAPQEQVRVRADLLDNLVNHAGEVAIYRSRLEQQLGAFRAAMAELDRTNARLRDQLRRLDLETEAQIVARYQREQDSADPTFDPLELDRFSTLQQLSRALNESAADLTGLQGVLDDLARQYDVLLQQQSRVSSELQDGLMSARMVPFDSIVPRLRRTVRQSAHDTGKQVQLRLDGTHGELDRNVLDRMVAPLEHMLRNSVAHGLETPADRRSAGKDEEGTITIALRHEGSEIVLQVSDDGRGLDRAAIRRRAEQRGLIRPGAELTDAELDSVIFESGFTTVEKASQLAGRGVGMDVVRNEVRQLGGSVDIRSTTGQGVTFTLRLPQTLAVTQAVFVQIGDTTYAVPVASVSGIGRISRERFEAGTGGYRYAGEEYALHDLGLLVGQGPAKAEGQPQVPLLLVRAGDLRAAVAIDQVIGNREIVVKPVGLQISSVPGIYGATITGDGRVVVILDVAPLVRRHLAQPERPAAQVDTQAQRHVPLVMVVDDSLTMRKVTGRVLERHNFEVVTARDGIEALERLEERVPDLMLLDIEMPRMDGYELATAMRADARFRDVPIVMITSRTGEKHRQRAFEIGVQRYLGKPYQELDLMRNVYDLLGIARARG